MGNHQRLEIRSWASALRMAERVDFEWQPGVWYRMKLRVDADEDGALIRGKVWPKSQPEPEEVADYGRGPPAHPAGQSRTLWILTDPGVFRQRKGNE